MTTINTCTQSGGPEAGTRTHMLATCHDCDAANWCWADASPSATQPECAACDRIPVCHPEAIEDHTADCAECDHRQLCQATARRDGHCLLHDQAAPCEI